MRKKDATLLPLDTEIEVVAIKGKQVFKKLIKYEDALKMNKKPGYFYYFFQKGFSQFN